MVKYKIKQLTIETSRAINLSKNTVAKYEKRINDIKDSNKYSDKKEVTNLQKLIKDFYENQTNAAKIRSRIKYFEDGEKSTKFFLNTEKRNASDKTWNKIKCRDGTYKTDIHSILNEQVNFYQTLFTSNGYDNIEAEYFLQNIERKLSEQEKLHCDRDITEDEIFKVITQLKLNKSPGDDGIVSEFYVTYWSLIKHEFTKVIKHILDINTLTPSQNRAMLTLLYKKGEREDIANWRPISLLNVDYKIITKLLSERLKPLLPQIIHSDQKRYVNGRNISEANRLLQDIIDYSEQNNINSSIIFLDYQKAFDRVEWGWALKCLNRFNFGPKFIGWIQMIYKNAKTCLLTNGYRSSYFRISRSMRQGCPVSPLIYILQAEPLACTIRNNHNIVGFPLPNPDTDETAVVKLSAYVDDSQFFNSTENSIKESFKIFYKFEKASGAKIHKTKTTAMYIGPWKSKEPEFKEISWTNTYVKTLGISHGYHIPEQEVWMEKIKKMKNCIQVWKSRDLTLKGKVLIIKTFLISQINYEIEMKSIPKNIVKEIDKTLLNFLWNGKQPLVNKQTICLEVEKGGLNMINLNTFIQAKHIKIIHKIINSETQHWNMIGKHWLKYLDKTYNSENFLYHCSNIKGIQTTPSSQFYKDAIQSWVSFRSKLQTNDLKSILDENICGNNRIIHKNAPLWFETFSKNEIKSIKDIWDSDNKTFIDENNILSKLTDKRNGVKRYRIIKSSIDEEWLNILRSDQSNISENDQNKRKIAIRKDVKQISKMPLKQLQCLLNENTAQPKYIDKWNTSLNTDINWKKCWKNSLETPLSNKEKQMHWKIIHNAIFTEYRLSLIGRSEGKCHFCKTEIEYLTHLFCECAVIKDVLANVNIKINATLQRNGHENVHLDLQHVILGFESSDNNIRIYLNTILHIVKWEVWKIRNLIKYENKSFPATAILKSILTKTGSCTQFLKVTKAAGKYTNVLDLLAQFR